MEDEQPTLRNIAKEVFSPGYATRAEKRRRAKTLWDLVFLPVRIALIGGVWYLFYRSFLTVHLLIYPENAGHLAQMMKGQGRLAAFLMTLPIFFSSIPLGLMLSNALVWLIPQARKTAEVKAKGVKWADYRHSQAALWAIFIFLTIPALIAGLTGAILLGRY